MFDLKERMETLEEYASSLAEGFTIDDVEVQDNMGRPAAPGAGGGLAMKLPWTPGTLGGHFVQDANKGRSYKPNQIEKAKARFVKAVNKAYSQAKTKVGQVVNFAGDYIFVEKVDGHNHVSGFRMNHDKLPMKIKDVTPVYYSVLSKQDIKNSSKNFNVGQTFWDAIVKVYGLKDGDIK